MAAESGIDETVEEETPEALREQIKKLKGEVKLFKYASFIGIPAMYALSLAMMAAMLWERPERIYSVLTGHNEKPHQEIGDLDGNGISDLVLEHSDYGLTPFFGYKFSDGSVTYVKYDEMERLNPNSTVDYKCINDALRGDTALFTLTDEQRNKLDIKRRFLAEDGFDATVYVFDSSEIKCVKGSSDSK